MQTQTAPKTEYHTIKYIFFAELGIQIGGEGLKNVTLHIVKSSCRPKSQWCAKLLTMLLIF